MKIRPVGAELFQTDSRKEGQTDRQTDMTKLIFAFRNFANAPNRTCALSNDDTKLTECNQLGIFLGNHTRTNRIWI